jgi:hypothetical protein
VTFFVAVTAVFAARAVRGGSAVELVLAAVAFGLALGTKELTFFAVPGLVLIVGASWWRYRPPLRLLVTGVGAAAAAVVAFGSFNYVQNLVHTGKLNGGLSAAVGVDFVHAGAIRDLARVSSTLLDAPGLPGASTVDRLLEPLATRVVGTVHGSYYGTPPPVHTEVDDSESGYGLLGLLVLVPIVVIALWRGPAPQRFLALGALIYLVLFTARMGYAPVAPRLLLPAAALVAPLLARLDDHRAARWAMVAVALAGVGPTLTLNTHKPLLLGGERSVLRADRVEAQLIDGEDRQFIPAVKALNRLIPAHGKLGMVGGDPPLTYVLYDAGLRRDVVSLDASELDPGALRRRGFLGAFVWPSPPPDDCSPVDCPPVRLPASAVPLPGGAAFVGVAGSAGQGERGWCSRSYGEPQGSRRNFGSPRPRGTGPAGGASASGGVSRSPRRPAPDQD